MRGRKRALFLRRSEALSGAESWLVRAEIVDTRVSARGAETRGTANIISETAEQRSASPHVDVDVHISLTNTVMARQCSSS